MIVGLVLGVGLIGKLLVGVVVFIVVGLFIVLFGIGCWCFFVLVLVVVGLFVVGLVRLFDI